MVEVLDVNSEVRRAIAKDQSGESLRDVAQATGMVTPRDQAVCLVEEGRGVRRRARRHS